MATVIHRMLMATAIPHTATDMDIGRIGTGLFGRVGTGLIGDIGTGALDTASIGQSMPQLMAPDFTAGDRLSRRKSDEEKP